VYDVKYIRNQEGTGMVKAITSENFDAEVMDSRRLVVIDMYADWCGPCKMMAPIIESLSNEYEDVKFVKINVDDNPDIAARYHVESIPNFVFIKDGKMVNQVVGARDADSFADLVDAARI